jgi:hypothetical protein
MNKLKEVEIGKAYSTHGTEEECIEGFVGKARKNTLLGRPGPRWDDNIKINLRDIGWVDMDVIDLNQNIFTYPGFRD